MLKYISKRPLTLIRWPDGIQGKKFYTKNKPTWTKKWIPTTFLPWDEDNEYLLANKTPHLVWLANLAALEIHTMNSRMSNINKPDHFIVDLDPPENSNFEEVKEIAFKIKEHLEAYGYFPFAKLSGSKGIHITSCIEANWEYKEVMEVIKSLMKEFIKKNPSTTLFVHKEKRKQKTLLDIYRNHPGNTTVAPYSLRGKSKAPVSMPLPWEQIAKTQSADEYDMDKCLTYVKSHGDAWENIFQKSSKIHTAHAIHPMPIAPKDEESSISRKGKIKTDQAEDNSIKTPLKDYQDKRDFSKTAEPGITDESANDVNDKFVIQMHDATNLHFDLRLGVEGVLKSWAIPKGIPLEKGLKRLAILTEDHPAKYLSFEGTIPKGEYGGGDMWVFESGTIEWLKYTKNDLKFKLISKQINGNFAMYQLKDGKEWIIEKKEDSPLRFFESPPKPMLSDVSKVIPKKAGDYLYEIKWDGIRVMIYKKANEIKILSRSGRDISKQFPEILDPKWIRVQEAIIDAELVCLDAEGRPVFSDIISRMHSMGASKIEHLSKSKKACLYTFDCIFINGKEMISMPFEKRHDWLEAIIKTGDLIRISNTFEDGAALYEAAKQMNLEGIMAKKKKGKYTLGARSDAWKKIKFRQSMECHIIGYTEGKGDRKGVFGALHIATKIDGAWKYYGKVGTGFDRTKLEDIWFKIKDLAPSPKPINVNIEEENRTKWINPSYLCEVTYASLSSNETLREPVFIKMWKEV